MVYRWGTLRMIRRGIPALGHAMWDNERRSPPNGSNVPEKSILADTMKGSGMPEGNLGSNNRRDIISRGESGKGTGREDLSDSSDKS